MNTYDVAGRVVLRVDAESGTEAVQRVNELLAGVTGVKQNLGPFSVNQICPLPEFWKLGMPVEYRRSADFAWSKGTRGRIHRMDSPDKPANEYQVFWVHSLLENGEVDEDYSWWTTPSDVIWIQEKAA